MAFDQDKLVKLVVGGPELNKEFLTAALKVMAELDGQAGDFDISAVEEAALGPLLSTESARIAKLIGGCHERGEEWVSRWNARVRGCSPEEEAELNRRIAALRAGGVRPEGGDAPKLPDTPEEAAARELIKTLGAP